MHVGTRSEQGNHVHVYLHIERVSESRPQVFTRDACGDTLECQVWTDKLRAVHLWSDNPWSRFAPGVNRAVTTLRDLSLTPQQLQLKNQTLSASFPCQDPCLHEWCMIACCECHIWIGGVQESFSRGFFSFHGDKNTCLAPLYTSLKVLMHYMLLHA